MMRSNSWPYRRRTPLPPTGRLYLLVFLAAAGLYLLTCQHGVSWQDGGTFQLRAWRGELTNPLGLALAHPLYVAVGWLLKFVPLGSFTWRFNAFNSLGMAVACANLAALALVLTGRWWVALATAAMTALAHTPWWLATVAEAGYTWSLAGFTAELWLLAMLLRRPGVGKLLALAVVSGLGLCVHNLALLSLPVYAIIAIILTLRQRLPAWSMLAAAGGWMLGAGFYLGIIIAEVAGGAALGETLRSALFGSQFQDQVLNTALELGGAARANLVLMSLNLLGPQLLCLLGLWVLRRRLGGALAAAILVLGVIHLLFVLRYRVMDQFMFCLPTLAIVNLLAAVGLAQLASAGRAWRRVAMAVVVIWVIATPLAYALVPSAVSVARPRALPYRDEARYWLTPWKQAENSAQVFAESVLTGDNKVVEDAYIIADPTTYYPLALVQQLGDLRPDVTIIDMGGSWSELPHPTDGLEEFFAAAAGRRVYVVSNVPGYCPKPLQDLTVPAGDVYLIQPVAKND